MTDTQKECDKCKGVKAEFGEYLARHSRKIAESVESNNAIIAKLAKEAPKR